MLKYWYQTSQTGKVLLMRSTLKGWGRSRMWKKSFPALVAMYLQKPVLPTPLKSEMRYASKCQYPSSFFKEHRLILLEPIQCNKCTLNIWFSSKTHQESRLSMNSSPSSFYRVQPIPEWTPIGNHELGPALTCSWLSHKNKLKLHVYNVINPRPNIWGWFQPNPF